MSDPVGGIQRAGQRIDVRVSDEGPGRSFRDVLEDAAKSIDRGRRQLDRAIARGHAGQTLSQEQLLALQGTVYRYTQELEIASKLVDKSTASVRTVLQSQQ
jgi:hypothetical protein